MLEVRVRLLPHGLEMGAQTIDTIWIANRGDGTRRIANYDVYLVDPRDGGQPFTEVLRHRRGLGAWHLVRRAIAAIEG